jgi:hypothetical protein
VWSVEGLWLVLVALYVADALMVCDAGDAVIVGWRSGTARVRPGVEVWLGRPRVVTWGKLLPPLDPPFIVSGARIDADAAAARHLRLFAGLRLLRVLTTALFVAVFLLLPGTVIAPYGWYRPAPVLALIAICWISVVVATVVARRGVLTDDQPRPSVTATLLSPLSAIRATDALAARAFAAWHPVVVARLLCGREDYLALARARCFAAPPSDLALLTAFLRSVGDWDAVQAPPAAESGCSSFCPSCHTQFRAGPTACPDCGVPLRAHSLAVALSAVS